MKTRSKLFSRFDLADEENKKFATHLRQLLDVSDEARKACIASLADASLAETDTEREAVTVPLAKRTGLTHVEQNSVLNVLRFFALKMIHALEEESLKDDDPEKWGADLCALELITESERPAFVEALRSVEADVLPRLKEERRRRFYTTGVFPHLKSLGTTVELRGIQEDEYDWSKSVEDYTPNFIGLTPVASIHIGLRKADPEDIYFQLDERDLERVIDSLVAVRKDIEELKKCIPNSRSQAKKDSDS